MAIQAPENPAFTLHSSVVWTIVAVGLSVIGYAWYLAAEQGTSKNQIVDLERRMSTVEQFGSPLVQSLKTQLQINDARLGNLEANVGKNINELLINNATQDATIKRNTAEADRLRDWRVQETNDLSDIRRTIAELRGDAIALRSRVDMLGKWIDQHQERDEGQGQSLAALKLSLETLNKRLDRIDSRTDVYLDTKGKP